jgi:hypothetical protein
MQVRSRLLIGVLVAVVCVGTPSILAVPSEAVSRATAGPDVIAEWNEIAARTIFTENATPIPSSGLYFGFVSIAVYDAVVSIEGGYQPYFDQRGSRRASSEVAAATAAYRILRHYFPASAENLRADYQASLADLPRGDAMAHGKQVGKDAAMSVIRSRRHDGRDASVQLVVDPAPGAWRPTPDAFSPMALPWLGFVKPLLLDSPTQIPLPGPDGLDTDAYARDFAEVKAFGAKDGSSRSAAQTETALFFNSNSVLQYQVGLRDEVSRRGLDIVESSRAFAILGSTTADALIACWRSKYDYAYWRPITAIQLADTDGNDATAPDPAWTPLVPTPPYPDYVSGHACITGAASGTLAYLFGADTVDLNLFSGVTSTTRHYDTVDALDVDTMNARIWLGLHFRKAMTDGNLLGHDVSDWAIRHYFQPTG